MRCFKKSCRKRIWIWQKFEEFQGNSEHIGYKYFHKKCAEPIFNNFTKAMLKEKSTIIKVE